MEKVWRKRNKPTRYEEYTIYSSSEASALGIPYIPARECRSSGVYVLLDDDIVAPVTKFYTLNRNRYTDHKTRYKCITPVCTYICGGYCTPQIKRGTTLRHKKICGLRYRVLARALLIMLMSGNINYSYLARIWDPKDIIAVPKLKKLLRRKEVMDSLKQEIMRDLEVEGYSIPWILAEYKEAMTMAKTKKDITNYLRILETFVDIFGIKGALHTPRIPERTPPQEIEAHEVEYTEYEEQLKEVNT